ncbi:hypothetical protein L6258_00310 [Candidatus Parcubacteria bacterium]|nr:hypothetical protein [Candidatus Parcubacteria bacterium]
MLEEGRSSDNAEGQFSESSGGGVLDDFATELGHGIRGCFLGCGPLMTLLPMFIFLLRVVGMEVFPALLFTLIICFLVIPVALKTERWVIAAIVILALMFYCFTQFVVNWQEVLFGWVGDLLGISGGPGSGGLEPLKPGGPPSID